MFKSLKLATINHKLKTIIENCDRELFTNNFYLTIAC